MKKILLIIIAVQFVESLVYSQITPPPPPPPPITLSKPAGPIVEPAKYKCDLGDEASIDNNTGKEVYFSYSSDEENWTDEKIENHKTFRIKGALVTKFYIRITTNGNSQTKEISNKCYYIAWNTGKGMWELKEYK